DDFVSPLTSRSLVKVVEQDTSSAVMIDSWIQEKVFLYTQRHPEESPWKRTLPVYEVLDFLFPTVDLELELDWDRAHHYHGYVLSLLKNTNTNELAVLDHKASLLTKLGVYYRDLYADNDSAKVFFKQALRLYQSVSLDDPRIFDVLYQLVVLEKITAGLQRRLLKLNEMLLANLTESKLTPPEPVDIKFFFSQIRCKIKPCNPNERSDCKPCSEALFLQNYSLRTQNLLPLMTVCCFDKDELSIMAYPEESCFGCDDFCARTPNLNHLSLFSPLQWQNFLHNPHLNESAKLKILAELVDNSRALLSNRNHPELVKALLLLGLATYRVNPTDSQVSDSIRDGLRMSLELNHTGNSSLILQSYQILIDSYQRAFGCMLWIPKWMARWIPGNLEHALATLLTCQEAVKTLTGHI
ncbi:MAG: hypothetical protein WCK42_05460, partial [Myxococcaceae bacterium]